MTARAAPQRATEMMPALDQAAGLRRILQRRAVRVLPMLGSGSEHWVAVLLAEALARQGERVLLIDQGAGEAAAALDVQPRHTLGEVLAGRCELDDAVGLGVHGVHAAVAGDLFERLRAHDIGAEAFFSAFVHVPAPIDLVLVRVTQPAVIARCLDEEGEILLSTSTDAPGVFAAYSNVKRSCARSHRYRVVVHGVDAPAHAHAVYQRVARTASRFLGVAPLYAGQLPIDPQPSADSPRRLAARAAERLAADVVTWPLAAFSSDARGLDAAPQTH